MTQAFDDRIVRVEIQYPDMTKVYEKLYIRASGERAISSVAGNCTITLLNMLKSDRDLLISLTSLQNLSRQPVIVKLDVGRISTGVFTIYIGTMIASYSSQPPDIGMTLQSTENARNSLFVANGDYPVIVTIADIARKIAADSKLTLDFQVTNNKQIVNFQSGGVSQSQQIRALNELGVNSFVDNGVLVVLDIGASRSTVVNLISAKTGMLEVPQITLDGVVVKVLLSKNLRLGDKVTIESVQNPAANGEYIIIKMNYEVANRDMPFYYQLLVQKQEFLRGINFL